MSEAQDDIQLRNNRLVLLTIIGIPVTMILTGTWLWYFVINGKLDLVDALGTANMGTLVQPPRQLDDYPLLAQNGEAGPYADLPLKWTLLVVNNDPVCDATCENSLYMTRQIHIAMGKELNRIDRMYISEVPVVETQLGVAQLSDERPAPASFAEYLEAEQKGLTPLVLGDRAFDQLFPELAADQTTWYLVDPAGWVMMSYTGDISYKDVISDLKFLLKNSNG
ncbi:hypothetical protein A3709_01375 [Halioglobus sp. HI00S01]|uniref:hypothetical protein n=1 Tax=Halioglobus sp. HI00S01 TaxID=1822214 RepID=UPI0007C3276D|nr:hypothetical protein [Halioglobus sp. HI00S01]KZX58147.1 hypothetical protein A3709_01375 [Halioglobus sp. HI00S01]